MSRKAAEDVDYFFDFWPSFWAFVPAAADEVFEFYFDVFWQFGSEVFLCELGLDFLESELAVLSVAGDYFVEE